MNGVTSLEKRRIRALMKAGKHSGKYKDGMRIELQWGRPAEKSYGWRVWNDRVPGPWKDVTVQPAPK